MEDGGGGREGGREGREEGREGGERGIFFFLRSKDWDVSHESWRIRMNRGGFA